MPCDTYRKPRQTAAERKAEVRKAIEALEKKLNARLVKVKIGPQGAVAFEGWAEGTENRVTDACAYRMIMSTGSALARAEITKAEQLSGRTISREALTQGIHSHNGGRDWHNGHKKN